MGNVTANREIQLPLSPEGQTFLKNCSENYARIVSKSFLAADLVLTYSCWYPHMVDVNMLEKPNTNGQPLDYLANAEASAFLLLGMLIMLGFINAKAERDKIKNEEEEQRKKNYVYKYHNELNKKHTFVNPVAELPTENKDREEGLQNAFNACAGLKEKYSAVRIENNHLCLTLKEDPVLAAEKPVGFIQKINNIFTRPLWGALSITSFAYWILWMSIGTKTGIFTVGVGLEAASLVTVSLIGFGIPLLFGLTYLALTAYQNYKIHKAQQKSPTHAATEAAKMDALTLFQTVASQRKMHYERSALLAFLGEDAVEAVVKEPELYSETLHNEVSELGAHAGKKSFMSGFSSASSAFINAQYGMWFISDVLLKTARVVIEGVANTILGGIFLGGSIFYGAYNAKKTYDKVKLTAQKIQEHIAKAKSRGEEIEAKYQKQTEEYEALHQQWIALGGKAEDVPAQMKPLDLDFSPAPKNLSSREKTKKNAKSALMFINSMMSGIFVLRNLVVAGTTSFLPFKALTAVLAVGALSNPIVLATVISILFIGGALFAYFKRKEHQVKQKEARAQALFQQTQAKIAHMKGQTELADLKIKVMKKKIEMKKTEQKLRSGPGVSSSATCVAVASATGMFHHPVVAPTSANNTSAAPDIAPLIRH